MEYILIVEVLATYLMSERRERVFMASSKNQNLMVTIGIAAVGAVGKAIVDKAPELIDKIQKAQLERQKLKNEQKINQVMVPDVKNKEIEEAIYLIRDMDLTPNEVSIKKANRKYIDYEAGVIVRAIPKPGKYVNKKTAIRLEYLTQNILDKSLQLAADHENKKIQQSQERRERIQAMLPKSKANS